MLNNYNGGAGYLIYYVKHYIEEKNKRQLYERYVANSLGKIAGAEKSYDDLWVAITRKAEPQRTAEEIKSDLLTKFNKEKPNEHI